MVAFPGILATLLTSTVLGVTLLVKRFRPLLPATLLTLAIPVAAGILQATSLGSAMLAVVLGRRIARAETPERTQSELTV